MEILYAYLSGIEFRQRVEAIVEAFVSMQEDLQEERRSTERRWAKREKTIQRVITNTSGMYGDLQGLVGFLAGKYPGSDRRRLISEIGKRRLNNAQENKCRNGAWLVAGNAVLDRCSSMAVFLWSANKQADECYEAAKRAGIKADECKSFWERTTSDPTAAFTAGIFIFNIVLGLSTVALWRVTGRSTDIAERAFSDLERPYVYIFAAKGLERDSDRPDPYDFLHYSVANYGKLPPASSPPTLKSALDNRPRMQFRSVNG